MRLKTAMLLAGALVPFLLAGEGKSPPSRDGSDLLGTRMPALAFERWIGTPDGKAPTAEDGPVLYRWWTSGCSFCESSLPGIDGLREKYEAKGLRVVAVFHPKPVREVSDEVIREAATKMGFHGTVAVDADWSELKRLWLDAGDRRATSVTVLADGEGVIRFVHPGPTIFPSDDPEHAAENKSFEELERVVEKLLAGEDAQ